MNSTSISVTCSTLCCCSLEHQPKNDHFRQHAEYLLVRNALSRRATCLTFNTAAGSQPIETMLMSFENPLNSTSGSAVKLGKSYFLLFADFETRHFGSVFSCLALNSAAGSQPSKLFMKSWDNQLNSTSISVICSTLCCCSFEHQLKNDHFGRVSRISAGKKCIESSRDVFGV